MKSRRMILLKTVLDDDKINWQNM